MPSSKQGSFPDDERLIAFINDQPKMPRVKEIARAFGLRMQHRSLLRKRLKNLARAGHINDEQSEERPQTIFGQVIMGRYGMAIQPLERKKHRKIAINNPASDLVVGDIVEASITRDGPRRLAKIKRHIGKSNNREIFTQLAIAQFNIPHVFPPDAISEAENAILPDIKGRQDLREIPFITIDGEDARDFDDAVYAEPFHEGFKIIVAIADVSAFVPPHSALDIEAQRRGNSTYFPDRVIPMLPEALSNGLCSLVEGEDRACLVAEIIIDAKGEKKAHRFMRAMIKSKARLTYTVVEAYRLQQNPSMPQKFDKKNLDHLFAAHKCLTQARQKRGALNLDFPEKKIILDDHLSPLAVKLLYQNESQKLIEDMMILANVAAAETLENHTLCVFRAHEKPSAEKCDEFYKIIKEMGIKSIPRKMFTAKDFNAVLKSAEKAQNPIAKTTINEAVLRCQAQAHYSIKNPGHFGLALKAYAHFTSPIRRYADLMVHRAIINTIDHEKISLPSPQEATIISQDISQTERQSTNAERQVKDQFMTLLTLDKVGSVTTGRITSITTFGAFVQLNDNGAEGLLPFAKMPDDFYEINTAKTQIRGRKNRLTLNTGQDIQVYVHDANPLTASITLGIVENTARIRAKKKKKRN